MRAQHHRQTIKLEGGSLRVGVVADTHSSLHPEGLRHLNALRPAVILHAGDVGDPGVLKELAQVAPVLAVRGNIDGRAPDLPDTLRIDFIDGEQRALTVLLTHIAVAGLRIRPDAATKARAASASLIVCGHSHVPFLTQQHGLTLFNPGSMGPRRFNLPILFGVMEISPTAVNLHHLDCETGHRWRPQ